MADELTAGLLRQLTQISQEGLGQPVDWSETPGSSAHGTDAAGHVRIDLKGFEVAGVDIDADWLAGTSAAGVQEAVKEAVGAALQALVDAEIEAAMNTSYEKADVHAKLIKLSAEGADAMNERIRRLGESV